MMTEGLNIADDSAVLLPVRSTSVTLPDGQLFHYIRDDELDRIGEMRKDLVIEICIASVGVFAGSFTPAFDGFKRFGAAQHPATSTDLVSMMLCFTALVVAIMTGLQWHQRSKSHKGMVSEIRGRPTVPVKPSHGE